MSKKKPATDKKVDKPNGLANKRKLLPQKENQNLNGPPQVKKQKSQEKPQQNGTAVEKVAKVPANKRKLPEQDNQKEVEDTGPAQPEKRIDSSNINKAIFTIFNKLQDANKQNTQKHVNEMIALLISETSANKRTATCAYALKRLVRCTGADDKESVGLNASYINSILREVPGLDLIELLDLLKRELHVGSQQRGKDDSLAAVGQLITVFAILQSQYFQEPSTALITAVYPILVAQLKGREYLVTLCADIMAESFKQVSPAVFQTNVWPLLQPELSKPAATQTLHCCDLLLAVHLNYPKVMPLRQLQSLLCRKPGQYEQLFELYLNSGSIQSDGVYARLGKFLATITSEQLLGAWQKHVAEQLPLKQSNAKCYVIQTLTHVLLHYDDGKQSGGQLEQLFALEPLLSLVLQELKAAKWLTIKAKAKAKAKPAQLQLRGICRKFETSLLVCFKHQLKKDNSKLSILRPLLQQQLQLDNVVQTPRLTHQLLAQLGEQGLEQMYNFYCAQFTSDNEQLPKTQREHCLKQMQQLQHSQRNKQLEFLLNASLFHLDGQLQPCTVEQAALFSRQAASRCEESLFGCLIEKIGANNAEQLAAFNAQLRPLLAQLAKKLVKPGIETKLRIQRTPEMQQLWRQVETVINTPAKEQQPLAVIFDALIMFLGLAMLMPSCNVSLELLNDLFICKQNALKAKSGKDKKIKAATDTEPKWQDVLTDVLLQLLLQTGHFWRSFVNAIGGALMPQLGRDNLEQLLDMLDISKNPLADKDWELDDGVRDTVEDDEDDDASSNDEEEENEDDEDDDDEDELEENGDDTDDDEDEDEENDNDDDDDDDDDELTNMDLIRDQVRKALLNDKEDDDLECSSIDWNDVDEEQGNRLNQALERAFQAHKPKRSTSSSAKSKRLTKSERVTSTALLHFRVRVLDLVELFVSAQPQLELVLDALTCVHQVVQTSSKDPKLQPLAEASKKTLRKLLAQKITYSSPQEDKEPIIDCIQQLMAQEQTPPPSDGPAQPTRNKIKGDLAAWRNKCIAYLVSQYNEPKVTTTAVWTLLQSYLQDWANRRNSPHQLATFDAILTSPWNGIVRFTSSFYGLLSSKLRLYRRVQILELLLKHCRRICNVPSDKLATIKEFHGTLAKYEPVADKDRNLQKKLLAQLTKMLTEAKGNV